MLSLSIGLALAARLTEDVNISVLVLEAGEEKLDDPLIVNIGQYGRTFGQEEYDWCSKTTPQSNADNRSYIWPRGRMIGGSSAVNFVTYNKPSKEDIDAWERLGNEGWNWDRFNKYMERAVTFTPPDLSEEEHARRGMPDSVRELGKKPLGNGPIQVSYPPLRTDIDIQVQRTSQTLGVPMAPAPLDGNPSGVVIGPMTIDPKTIKRSFAANAHWQPNSARPNFNMLTGACAHRLVTIQKDGELLVTGVEFSHKDGGKGVYTAEASKEVILSAGALMTPQLLELSGIGRPDVLERVGIPVKLALEGVGENVQEHIHAPVVYQLKDGLPDETYDVLLDPEAVEKHRKLFANGEGLFTMGVVTFIFAPFPSLSHNAQEIKSEARKKIESEIAAGKYAPAVVEQYKIILERIDRQPSCEVIGFPGYYGGDNPPVPGKKYYTLVPALNSMFSRGTIHITTSDPTVQPAMDPHYFEQDIDLKMFIELAKFCRKIANTLPLKDYFDEATFELNPGANISGDKELADYLIRHLSSTFHTTGTASMLPQEKGGVVDTRLKVYGTKNLRVADLSIVPLIVGSHTQSVAYGIGEIAADIIKGIA
ncbi:hypothetical protein Ac2012v2_003572 [Leucoagaricus gongylophorus]